MQRPWFLTCFAQNESYIREMHGMLQTFHEHNPGAPAIVGFNPYPDLPWAELTRCKAEWILDTWQKHQDRGAMLWVDADARFRRGVHPPAERYDIAAQYYADIAVTGTMWFQGPRVEKALECWVDELSPDDEGDEASFRRGCARAGVDVLPIPRDVSSICSSAVHGFKGALEFDSAIVHWNLSRSTCGLVEDWPPTEEVRRTATV